MLENSSKINNKGFNDGNINILIPGVPKFVRTVVNWEAGSVTKTGIKSVIQHPFNDN